MLTLASLPRLQDAIRQSGIDGWLLFDFRGINPVASGLLQLQGMVTRRVFAWIPAEGVPVAITHAIEQGPWSGWPRQWDREIYSSWRRLEELVAQLVRGKRVAMEYSPGDAVPYVDLVPAGVIELVRAAGAREIVSSGELVSRFYAGWSEEGLAAHRRAAAAIALIAQEAAALAGARARDGAPLSEFGLQQWILERFRERDLETDHGPIVAVGANAANPHYAPAAEGSAPIARESILLIDLFAAERGGIYADQTWMAVLGRPSDRAQHVWQTIRDARDAAISLLRTRIESGTPVRGGEADDAARAVVSAAGYGAYFVHRTGHSIDARSLHGAGPHLDNLETREERLLLPGVGFSIEPGVYVTGEIGMRTEVNAFVRERELVVTPDVVQSDLLLV